MEKRKRPLPILALLIVLLGLSLAACGTADSSESQAPEPIATPTTSALFSASPLAPPPTSDEMAADGETAVLPPSDSAAIRIDLAASATPIDKRVLGTNLPAWIGPDRTKAEIFLARTIASGTPIARIPGGSWSNGYDWLACETGADIEGNATCWSWPHGLGPSDFINFLRAANVEGMYTVNLNGTALEAAALVAFFNGAVDDDSVIGIDVRGRDWGRVSDWAKLRRDNGNPDPLPIRYWEIGNEIYGGREGMGTDCTAFGWEEVWTCDGREYALGIGEGNTRREGFLDFAAAMKKVDPTIQIGAVGVYPSAEWSDWGNEVIAAAGQTMDFYIIHHYAYFEPPGTEAEILALPQKTWAPIMADIEAAFDRVGNGRRVPIAVTEHNLFAFQNLDDDQLMTRAVNMLYLADSIGQMLQNGVAIANQWNLANGLAENGTDYGMLNADTYARSPQYYVFPLWAAFGDEMLPIESDYDAATTLSVYVGRDDAGVISIMAINKSGEPIKTAIQFDGETAVPSSGAATSVKADLLSSQTTTFNSALTPPDDLTQIPPITLTDLTNPLPYIFSPYSITHIRIVLLNE